MKQRMEEAILVEVLDNAGPERKRVKVLETIYNDSSSKSLQAGDIFASMNQNLFYANDHNIFSLVFESI